MIKSKMKGSVKSKRSCLILKRGLRGFVPDKPQSEIKHALDGHGGSNPGMPRVKKRRKSSSRTSFLATVNLQIYNYRKYVRVCEF
jgi:hypothetical protein